MEYMDFKKKDDREVLQLERFPLEKGELPVLHYPLLDACGMVKHCFTTKEDSYYNITADNVAVNSKSLQDPSYFSTATEMNNGEAKYDIAEKLLTLQKDVKMFRGDSAESFLETLLSDITVDVDKTNTNYKNYFNLQTAVNNQRTSVSGVDEDEEALNLIKFQNAYNLASKVISVMAEMYDKLINETGV